MTWTLCRALAPAAAMLAAVAAAHAQQQPNPNCSRLEAQLQAFDRSAADPARAEQVRKFEEAATSQQAEIDRQEATGRRMGCEGGGGFFVLFSSQPQQCGPLNSKIQQMKSNLDRIQADLERLQAGSSSSEREGQRRAILVALAQNSCGPQYRAAVAATEQRGGLFDSLFGPKSIFSEGPAGAFGPGGTYRTICVRTCDGYYYPISYATNQSRFAEDEKTCQKSCPAAEVMLFAHRNPGEDVSQAVSTTGQLYSTLPNAFRYRQAFDSSCSCRSPGQSWSQALKNVEDSTLEQGDIVVNEQRARQLSQPRVDAQGKPIRVEARPLPRPDQKPAAAAAAAPSAAPAASASSAQTGSTPDAEPVKPDPNRTVRAVGPTFIPAR